LISDKKSVVDRITRTRVLSVEAFSAPPRVFVSQTPWPGARAVDIRFYDGRYWSISGFVLCAVVGLAGRRQSLGIGGADGQRSISGGRLRAHGSR
jgi:hypothetical protein